MRGLFDEPEPTPELMPLQRKLIEAGKKAFVIGIKRVVFQAPCGSGKTWVAAEQTKMALEKDRTVLHIVHRRRLVDQMVNTLRRFGISSGVIMEGRKRWESKVQCASRDTLLAMLKDGRPLPKADLLDWDECHVKAAEVQDWYLKNSPESYWCGYTATPVLADGGSLNPPWQRLVSMGQTSEMIKLGRLCPVKVFNPDALGRRRKKGDKVKPVGDPVAHWIKYAMGLPTVAFAAKVADSKDIVRRYLEAGISAEHIDANTSDDDRDAVFNRSERGETKVISNVGVLVEGVDLPWLVCCQILRGCNSLVLWHQACGRVMRALPGKEFGIILDHAGAAHEFNPPDWDYEWVLGDATTNIGKNKPPKDKRPITCMVCGAVFKPKPICPECGHVMPKQKRSSPLPSISETGDGVLTEFNGQQVETIKGDTLNRLWKKLLYIGKAKGWQMRQCAGVFSREAKVPPWQAGLDFPLPSGKEGWSIPVKDWMETNR